MSLLDSAIAKRLGLGAPPWIVAHRGASADAPENTLEALRLAIDQGADLAEVDVRITGDGHLVLCHDPDLDRVAGADLVVERETLARSKAAYPALAELDEVLTTLSKTLPLNLEIKRTAASSLAIAEALARAVTGHHRLIVSSFDLDLLALVRSLLPGIALAPLERREPARGLSAAERLHATSLHVSRRIATRELAERAEWAGLPLLVYTVDDAAEAGELVAAGVSGLFTNRPAALRREIGAEA